MKIHYGSHQNKFDERNFSFTLSYSNYSFTWKKKSFYLKTKLCKKMLKLMDILYVYT